VSQLVHASEPVPSPVPTPPTRRATRFGPLGVAALFLLGKLKWVLAGLKMMNVGTLLSMLLSVGAYAMMWGWKFAVGFVLLLFVHELGHAIAMRRLGIPAGAPVFIPFVGAVIAMRGMPRNAWIEAVVGIGGPLLGTLGAAVCLLIGFATGHLFWFGLASTGFMLNLFNMIPVSPLDGGRIVGVVSRWLWFAGYAIGIAVFLVTFSPILALILLTGVFQFGKTWKVKSHNPGYYDVTAGKRASMAAAYFGLIAFMALGMWYATQPLSVLRGDEELMTMGLTFLFGLGRSLVEGAARDPERPAFSR
jgi:Zn-dependent protease